MLNVLPDWVKKNHEFSLLDIKESESSELIHTESQKMSDGQPDEEHRNDQADLDVNRESVSESGTGRNVTQVMP